jgi:FdhD protein
MAARILKQVDYTLLEGGFTRASERIIREAALAINIDGQPFATAMMLATMKKEFIAGNLFSQGIITSAADIISLVIRGHTADVTLAPGRPRWAAPTEVHSNLKISQEQVFNSVKAILRSEVFTETEAVHSAGLFLEGEGAVCIAEDLGRHNALDKVIGAGLFKGVDFSRTLAASTGRQPSEMLIKYRNAGIPVVTTKGVPTTLAIEIADKAGITIVGLVRGRTMTVYSHPERIV